jgi:hypothetical protein
MVERLTWKAGLGAGFFLHPMDCRWVDIWIHAVVASGCHGFAVDMAPT